MKWMFCLLGVLAFAVADVTAQEPTQDPNANGTQGIERPRRLRQRLMQPDAKRADPKQVAPQGDGNEIRELRIRLRELLRDRASAGRGRAQGGRGMFLRRGAQARRFAAPGRGRAGLGLGNRLRNPRAPFRGRGLGILPRAQGGGRALPGRGLGRGNGLRDGSGPRAGGRGPLRMQGDRGVGGGMRNGPPAGQRGSADTRTGRRAS